MALEECFFGAGRLGRGPKTTVFKSLASQEHDSSGRWNCSTVQISIFSRSWAEAFHSSQGQCDLPALLVWNHSVNSLRSGPWPTFDLSDTAVEHAAFTALCLCFHQTWGPARCLLKEVIEIQCKSRPDFQERERERKKNQQYFPGRRRQDALFRCPICGYGTSR